MQISLFNQMDSRKTYGATTIDDYASVSPIYFASAHELEQKLKSLKPKAKKKGGASDNSQANKAYETGSAGAGRGEFEHGRLVATLWYHLSISDGHLECSIAFSRIPSTQLIILYITLCGNRAFVLYHLLAIWGQWPAMEADPWIMAGPRPQISNQGYNWN